jgi:hypothetical protein
MNIYINVVYIGDIFALHKTYKKEEAEVLALN